MPSHVRRLERTGERLSPDDEPGVARLADEQSVLLWRACAYAEDVVAASESGRELRPARESLLRFIHYELLPYLRFEEGEFADWAPRGGPYHERQLVDHDRIRSGADRVESSQQGPPLTVATRTLVDRLDRHIRSEQEWAPEPTPAFPGRPAEPKGWVAPALGDWIDLEALPADDGDVLVLDRLQRMRPGDVVRLRAGADMHRLWCRQDTRSPGTHGWVYEQEGPIDWLVRVTRRDPVS